MGGAKGIATSLEGKVSKIEKVKGLLDSSQMVFHVPASGFTVKDVGTIRNSLPEGTTMSVVKNTLMNRAIDGTDYAVASELLKGSNMWFFIEDDIGATIKAYNSFIKEENKIETHDIIGGIIDGGLVDKKEVEAIGKLPTKLEMYAQIAGTIKAVPTKLARVVKAPGSKLARAIKLATDETAK